ncbi:GATA zinc finger domain-containing protein 1 [Toxorhynchites rutilus septentrionalis]|uniref:GATA zinc finger domain-containing protein 1 n=1 Tax=Toxorhynchites rutilus septentrionalis TaxID=329112 RepID=UPI00247A7D45|nr:GATA zinc finger domain-containing protein 1 [Toxorhynchites rutilus septentrionalis]
MGPKLAQKCAHCQACTTEKWHTVERGVVLCTPCYEKQEKEQTELENELKEIQAESMKIESQSDDPTPAHELPKEVEKNGSDKSQADKDTSPVDDVKEEATGEKDEKETDGGKERNAPSLSPRKLRKNVRSARKGGSGGTGANGGKTGRSRRFIFKKNPMKAPTITVTTRTVETLFHNNIYYQIGDIVSVMDANDDIYYAQIHGLQIDSYCEKSAYITWLIPTTSSPPPNEQFDPATYLIGPEEDLPRKLSCMEFVMHAPSSYYLDRHNPFPRPDTWGPENTSQEDNSNYIWANISHLYQS